MKTLFKIVLGITLLSSCTKIEYLDPPTKSLDSLIAASIKNLPAIKPPLPTIDTVIKHDTVFLVRQTIKYDTLFVNRPDTTFIIRQTIVRDTIFVAALASTVTDIDWNIYHTVVIGTQTWTQENLKTTRFNDGTKISVAGDSNYVSYNSTIPYYWTDYPYAGIFGSYYNCFAAKTGNLCPVGWHIPSIKEWTILTDYLGGSSVAGLKMIKPSADRDNINESGFSGVMSGILFWRGYSSNGKTYWFTENPSWNMEGRWWSSDEPSTTGLFIFDLVFDGTFSTANSVGEDGELTVRCLKNENTGKSLTHWKTWNSMSSKEKAALNIFLKNENAEKLLPQLLPQWNSWK
jgi:uncharacterized protein (TIGR02145 family)